MRGGEEGTALEAGSDSSSQVDLKRAVEKAFLMKRHQEWVPLVPLLGRGGERGGGFVRLFLHQVLGILSPHDLGMYKVRCWEGV